MRQVPKAHEVYRHFKGNLYQIITIANDSETLEQQVVYRQLYAPYEAYVRSLTMFLEEVDCEKYPNAQSRYRFELLEFEKGMIIQEEVKENLVHKQTEKISCNQDELLMNVNISNKQEQNIESKSSDDTEIELPPLFLQFFDEDTFAGKIKVLEQMKSIVTNRMITSMAVATDVTLNDTGEVEERYAELRSCLYALEKFECNR